MLLTPNVFVGDEDFIEIGCEACERLVRW